MLVYYMYVTRYKSRCIALVAFEVVKDTEYKLSLLTFRHLLSYIFNNSDL